MRSIRVNGADGKKYFAHTLNNTVVAPPRMLIAFLENNLQADGSVRIDHALCIHLLAVFAAAQIQGVKALLVIDRS